MPIEEAEKIAQSQVAWAILFILLFFIIIRLSYQDLGQAREEDYGFARAIKSRL